LGVPQAAKRERITEQINAAFVFAGADFVNVHHLFYLPCDYGDRVFHPVPRASFA
jgi:hypothetical protein